ncbi:MAG: hypothetical protein KF773_01545 [Deltaproteobacteria bacterium]|nr:hypothetical protein [Deltaproteobacteria bacterium]MCW5806579.1 hypothetical protein [Deltaproteobacteria bacterium]
MHVADLDEVTYDLEVDGDLVRRTLHRRVFERGAWATVVLAFEEKRPDGTWKPAKLALVRLQKVHDAWKKAAGMTLPGHDAAELARTITAWGLDDLADASDE